MIFSEMRKPDDHTFNWKIEPNSLPTYDPEKTVQTILYGGHRWRLEILGSSLEVVQQRSTVHCSRCDSCVFGNKNTEIGFFRLCKQSLWDSGASAGDMCESIEITLYDESKVLWEEEIVFNPMDKSSNSCIVGQTLAFDKYFITRNDRRLFLVISFGSKGTKSKVLEETKTAFVYSNTNEVLNAVETLLQNSEDSDATLVVKGIEFKAHQCILKARVPVFRSMFRADMEERKTGHVEITDCDPGAFKIFLQFLYSGKLDLQTEKNANELYYIADKYDVKELIDFCVKFMTSHWTVDTFFDYIEIGCNLAVNKEPELLKSGINFLAQNFSQITSSPEWMAYLRNNPEGANELIRKAYERLLQCTHM